MANHKSAKKRARQDLVRRARTRSYMSSVKTSIKKFQAGLTELQAGNTDAKEVQALLNLAQSALNKAAAKGRLHKNNAARRVSRLALAMNKATGK